MDTIYEVPLLFESFGPGRPRGAGAGAARGRRPADLTEWTALVERIKRPKPELEIALVGKYIELPDAYLSVTEALRHAGWAEERTISIRWVDSERLTAEDVDEQLGGRRGRPGAGRLRAPGHRGQGPRRALCPGARVPYLGLCLGLQCGVIEFARDVVGERDANSTEFDLFTERAGHRPDARPARGGGQGRHACAWASTRRA